MKTSLRLACVLGAALGLGLPARSADDPRAEREAQKKNYLQQIDAL